MSDFWRKAGTIAHGIGMIAGAISGHRPHFHMPHFPKPNLDPYIGLRNWFHAQWRLPRIPRPLPEPYQAKYDRFANRLMARRQHHRESRHHHFMATPPFRGRG